jgi:hypothetical protein
MLLLSALLISATPLAAHHTAAYTYDVDKPVTLKITVIEVDWKNPHVIVHADVHADNGAFVPWTFEARAAYIMKRRGFDQDFLKAGDSVDVTVCVAKDGAHQGELRSFSAPDGVKVVGQC